MKKKLNNPLSLPTKSDIKSEILRDEHKHLVFNNIKRIVFFSLGIAAIAVLISYLLFPALRIYGSSMTPTLYEGDIVVCHKSKSLNTGDLVAFYFENNILVKRYIAGPGQWVDIDENGNVYVDSKKIDEPYINEKAFGNCDINLPYQVPESKFFCMGDHRSVSVDSRSRSIGCIPDDKIVGKVFFRAFPLTDIQLLN